MIYSPYGTITIPFSWQAIGRIIFTGLMVFLVWKSIEIFIVIIIAMIIAAALYPIAKKMSKKIPMVLSVLLVIIILLIPIAVLIAVTLLTFGNQFPHALEVLTLLLEKFRLTPESIQNINLATYMRGNFGEFLDSTKQIALAIATILTGLFLIFYFMLDAKGLFTLFVELFPIKNRTKITELFQELALVTGQYIRGNLIISIICIITIYIGLLLLHIPFALPLAIFTGILDLLPLIGPVLGAIPALVFGFAISPLTGILVLVLYLVYKQIEDVFIGPAIYNKALKLSPALVFLSVVIGAGVFGIVGAFLALPVAASIPVIIRYKTDLMNT